MGRQMSVKSKLKDVTFPSFLYNNNRNRQRNRNEINAL